MLVLLISGIKVVSFQENTGDHLEPSQGPLTYTVFPLQELFPGSVHVFHCRNQNVVQV